MGEISQNWELPAANKRVSHYFPFWVFFPLPFVLSRVTVSYLHEHPPAAIASVAALGSAQLLLHNAVPSLLWLSTVDRKLPRTFASFYVLPLPHSFLNDSFLCAVPAPLVVSPRREGLQRPCFAPPESLCLLSHVSLLG